MIGYEPLKPRVVLGPAICHDCHSRLYLRQGPDTFGRPILYWRERHWTGYSWRWRRHECPARLAA